MANSEIITIKQDNKMDVVTIASDSSITINNKKISNVLISSANNSPSFSPRSTWLRHITQNPIVGSPSNYGAFSYIYTGNIFFEDVLTVLTLGALSIAIWSVMPEILAAGAVVSEVPTFIGAFCDTLAAKVSTLASTHAPNQDFITYKFYRATDTVLTTSLDKYYKCQIKYYINYTTYISGADFTYYLNEEYV